MAKKRRNRIRAVESHRNPWDESEASLLGYSGIDGIPESVTYSARGTQDWVVSGPLHPYRGHGRAFKSSSEALAWAQEKYGTWRVSLVEPQPKTRWAILVRKEIKLGRRDIIASRMGGKGV